MAIRPGYLAALGSLTLLVVAGCRSPGADAGSNADEQAYEIRGDYCEVPTLNADVALSRPAPSEPPIDDVNWFARPVPHDGDDWIIAFASHDQNQLYNLTTGQRVLIPDRSDAVATPDGRYMTVPSYYTPDSNTRFYPVAPLLDALARGEDADDLEPAFIHDHPAMHRVYYQSTAVVQEDETEGDRATTYRLMFSGTADESGFRIVDYRFEHDEEGVLLGVTASDPMAICPAVHNDLNTPFISKDGRYVAAYTSEAPGSTFAPGASLKVFEITSVDPAAGTTTCEPAADLGFAAGKADFSFDGSMLTFHSSQGAYLTPFVNGGLTEGTITDVLVARFTYDATGRIDGTSGLQRLTTSVSSGVGNYFPAFLPDGRLFYIANSLPRDSEGTKLFHFRVVDPMERTWRTRALADEADAALWRRLGALWQRACTPDLPELAAEPFPLDEHEIPLQALALDAGQCEGLVRDARAEAEAGSDLELRSDAQAGSDVELGSDAEARGEPTGEEAEWDDLVEVCRAIGS